jgi:hypothetical protein
MPALKGGGFFFFAKNDSRPRFPSRGNIVIAFDVAGKTRVFARR